MWGSLSEGFRAPTLKELYSPFRVGQVLTQSNETLGPERLTGEEVGVSVAPTDRLTVRGTFFNNRVNDPIANVTVTVNNVPVTPGAPACHVRQLQNLGSTNIGGFQTDAAYRVNAKWSVSAGYLFDIAKVHEAAVDAPACDLTGKYLARGAEASRDVPGDLHQPADSQRRARDAVRRAPVRRRPATRR